MNNVSTGKGVLLLALGVFIVRMVLRTFMDNALALWVALAGGAVIAGVWIFQQVKEAQAAEKLRERDRNYR